jgi:hypothetical protein
MRKALVVAALCLVPTVASAQHMDTADKALYAASTLALAGDWLTTVHMARAGWVGKEESNVILGSKPSVGKLNTYNAGFFVIHTAAALFLPKEVKKLYLVAVTALEATLILGNGCHFSFRI